jgi:transglutaminase-like putative cysteine protease
LTTRLTISHVTTYRYVRPVVLQPHRLLLRPRGSHDLTILEATLECSPAAALNWTQDVFGNLIATATFGAPTTELVISNHIVAQQSADDWPVFQIAPSAHAFPFEYSPPDAADLGGLLGVERSDATPGVGSWARAFVARPGTDTLSLLKDVNAGILGTIVYRVREEEGTQTGAATLALASGSCRDLAQLFIEAVRHLGFGARAVSGYLFDPTASGSQEGTTHAWAEVYLPGAGWIAFDPTHRRVGDANLVAVAVGRSPADIAPVSGGYSGAPDDFVGMDVQVRVARDA